jgi:threonine aldolase
MSASAAPLKCHFASDNTAGICPEAWAAMEAANDGYVPSYGDDVHTREASDLFRNVFETDCDVYFAFNGTAANSLALASLCQSYHSIIVHERAHVETDECGAPEFYSNGTKILLTAGEDGKLDVAEVERTITRRSDIHFPKPRALSLSQSTELGTVYTREEIRAVCATAKSHGLRTHMDGARFANAVASLGVPPAELTWKAGVDVLCFGGTKLGAGACSEAIIFFDRNLSGEFAYRCKQAGQLASKMRFLSAPWTALLRDDLWLEHAAHANAMARRLGEGLAALPGISLHRQPEANAVFATFPPAVAENLRARGWVFYSFIGLGGARLMCSWRTTEVEVDAFIADATEASG